MEKETKYIGIDLSTKTGFVAINKKGETLIAKEIKADSDKDPERMVSLTEKIVNRLFKNDVICIEGFSYASRGRGIDFQFGLGHHVRNTLYKKGIDYTIVAPSQVKKFATGKGNASKDNMILPIYKKWGFEHESDNVRDAYVLAQIARSMSLKIHLNKYQHEIITQMEGKTHEKVTT